MILIIALSIASLLGFHVNDHMIVAKAHDSTVLMAGADWISPTAAS